MNFVRHVPVLLNEGNELAVPGQVVQHRLQVDVIVRDVESQHPVVGELFQVEVECLPGEQVGGNGIAAEGVHDEQSVVPPGLAPE
jgi:hypothetical protein